ncbi:MAG: SRPBCC domain-containing protein [Kofleriaceae bacterium]|nr:SRPBCC domain-containing protein [Kofleriaceae bacterium]
MERKSERELVVSRTINGPARNVFDAWTKSELFSQWWVPKSLPVSLRACEMDVRVGGKYRLVFDFGAQTMEFFGVYREVIPCTRLVWTNDEGGAEAAAVTTVTFEERDGNNTLVTMHDLHPSKEAVDATIASGSTDCTPESWDQLEELVATLSR